MKMYKRILMACAWVGLAACAALPATGEDGLNVSRDESLPAETQAAAAGETPEAPTPNGEIGTIQPGDAVISTQPSTPADEAAMAAEQQARQDLSVYLKVESSMIETVAVEQRIWPEGVRSCVAQKGLAEPTPVSGWIVILRLNGVEYEYRVGRDGGMVRCPTVSKPLDPIR